MTMKILIAYDGSKGSDAALADLRRAGLPEAAEARILSIAEVFLPTAPDPTDTEGAQAAHTFPAQEWRLAALRDAHSLATDAAAQVSGMFPKWSVTAHARADSPGWGVIKEVDSWHPDLVVVGSEGRSGMGRLFLGSVSHQVLTEGRRTVRVARARDVSKDTPLRVIVGVDGSRGSDQALQAVADRTWPPGTEALLLAVVDPRMSTGLLPGPSTSDMRVLTGRQSQMNWVRVALERSEALLRDRGPSMTTLLAEGDPKRLLLEHAKQWSADCIFLGARGLTGMKRLLLGSVSATVAMRAPCSVEVIHSPSPSAAQGQPSDVPDH